MNKTIDIEIPTTIECTVRTETSGSKAFVVALSVGGIMEMPEIRYEDYQIIFAEDENEAREKYNELNNCSYFYGKVMCEWNDNIIDVL